MNEIKIAYFGGEPMGVPVLEELKASGIVPELIVANPDRPVGRKQIMTPPPVKSWAEAQGVDVFQPETINKEPTELGRLTTEDWDLFVVVAYNKILPRWLIELPKHQTLNVHPSLLPLLRGASPIRSTILNDMREQCGISIIVLDEKMDHGPIVAQQKMEISESTWPVSGLELDEALARLGGSILADVIPQWVLGALEATEQDHDQATFCGKIDKKDAELDLDPHNPPHGEEAHQTFLKIQAYTGWPGTYFMYEGKRFKITAAHLDQDSKLAIDTIIPEGKNEVAFSAIFG